MQTTFVVDDSKSAAKKMPHSKLKEPQIRPRSTESQADILNKKTNPINPINFADSNQMSDLNIQRLNSTRSAHNQPAFVKPTSPFFLFDENSSKTSQNLNKPTDKKFELSLKINNNLKIEDLY